MSGMLRWTIMDGGCLNMVDLSDIELEFSAQVLVSGAMDFDTLQDYMGNVEDYIINNMDDCDVEVSDIQESLNVVSSDDYFRLKLLVEKQVDQLEELAETVISLNEQIEVLRGN